MVEIRITKPEPAKLTYRSLSFLLSLHRFMYAIKSWHPNWKGLESEAWGGFNGNRLSVTAYELPLCPQGSFPSRVSPGCFTAEYLGPLGDAHLLSQVDEQGSMIQMGLCQHILPLSV